MMVNEKIHHIPISKLNISKFNVRKHDISTEISELRDNIAEIGVKNPISVHQKGNKYYVISGQRRYIASKKAGLKNIPCIIRKNISDIGIMIESFSENIFRTEMTLEDKGKAAEKLLKHFDGKKETVAEKLGVSVSSIDRYLNYRAIWPELRNMVANKKITQQLAIKLYKHYPTNKKQAIKLAQEFSKRKKEEQSDYDAAISDSNQNATLDEVNKKFKTISKTQKIQIRLPTKTTQYINKISKDENLNIETIIANFVQIGVSYHQKGMVQI